MVGVCRMLQRVAKLKAARSLKPSPIQLISCSVYAFSDKCMGEVSSSKPCAIDMPVLIAWVRRLHRDGDYDVRHTGNVVWNRA